MHQLLQAEAVVRNAHEVRGSWKIDLLEFGSHHKASCSEHLKLGSREPRLEAEIPIQEAHSEV
eukprot:CAMPEP_0117657670 /NCGR_PEP_ID=MMETSP0804-20121206/5454_1 /TAXON_ID=1074897 /ORGANISM="Tetraselmis astigmatica, Strain CCMP880" /LENGTH=62 /DNA_ID=CAMNT_0005464139 /DNA_START=635 /DNA_END=823 /DNA_ORIENTATION=-